jgi:hypothetical protein
MALKDIARSWLMNLPKESVSSREDLCQQFVANFKPTTNHHSTFNGLHQIRQEKGETMYQFMQRFSQVRNKVPRISQANIVSACTEGVTDLRMREISPCMMSLSPQLGSSPWPTNVPKRRRVGSSFEVT